MKGHLINPDGTVMTFISMGRLDDEQEAVVRNFVAGYNVHDLGAGQLGMANRLSDLGAHTVTAVDKDYEGNLDRYTDRRPNVSLVGETFEEYAKHGHFIDVAFVCWPECYGQDGIVELLNNVRTIIYLGSNFDGSACGHQDMWESLKRKEVLALVPGRWNSLIVYAGQKWVARRPLPEEYAALHRSGPFFKYGADLVV